MCLVSIMSSRVNTTYMVAVIIIITTTLIKEKHFQRMKDCKGSTCLCDPGGQHQGPRVEASVHQKEELSLDPSEKGQAKGRR